MPLPAVLVTLTAAERKALKKRIRGTRTAWRDRLRAQIVLAAAMGRCTARIARDLRISQDTARKWRGRFADRGLEGLSDLPRPGRPRQISAEVRAAVVALACQLPAATGVPLAHWTGPELAAELTAQNLVSSPVSASSVLRILAGYPVKPRQYRSWIYPRYAQLRIAGAMTSSGLCRVQRTQVLEPDRAGAVLGLWPVRAAHSRDAPDKCPVRGRKGACHVC